MFLLDVMINSSITGLRLEGGGGKKLKFSDRKLHISDRKYGCSKHFAPKIPQNGGPSNSKFCILEENVPTS